MTFKVIQDHDFHLPKTAYMRFPISDQYQTWPYLALFSHNTTVAHK